MRKASYRDISRKTREFLRLSRFPDLPFLIRRSQVRILPAALNAPSPAVSVAGKSSHPNTGFTPEGCASWLVAVAALQAARGSRAGRSRTSAGPRFVQHGSLRDREGSGRPSGIAANLCNFTAGGGAFPPMGSTSRTGLVVESAGRRACGGPRCALPREAFLAAGRVSDPRGSLRRRHVSDCRARPPRGDARSHRGRRPMITAGLATLDAADFDACVVGAGRSG
jgi:hypothetical protein